jgi:1,4-alpha-glucan branching enzyme
MRTESNGQLRAIVTGCCEEPFRVLGVQRSGPGGAGCVVRAFRPHAEAMTLLAGESRLEMSLCDSEGIFEVVLPEDVCRGLEDGPLPDYRFELAWPGGHTEIVDDPYRFGPVTAQEILDEFSDSGLPRVHEFLGARTLVHQGVAGTCFAVWAPGAASVGLMGEFNGWDARVHPMRRRGESGVWELFVPGVETGALYKYEVLTDPDAAAEAAPVETTTGKGKRGKVRGRTGRAGRKRPIRQKPERLAKADPVGFAAEVRPATASKVWDLEGFAWEDVDWMAQRPAVHASDAALSIYEVHLGSWRRRPGMADGDPAGWLSYRELAEQLLPYVKDLGFTHVELLPVTEHPLDASWGYQTVGYFAPTSRFGSPDDFKYLVDSAHRLGLGVILDWVPAHFPRDPHGLAQFDGTHLYDHEDPRRGSHPEWGTQIYDYGRAEVRSFLVSSALFWLEEYHVDGLRVDAVASMLYLDYAREKGEWLPNEFGGRENLEAIAFLRRLNEHVHTAVPDALIFAEESTAWPKVTHAPADGGLGFDMKWKMGWMNDTLSVMQTEPERRSELHDKLTFSIMYTFQERHLLPLSHDEVVHLKRSLLTKMPGTRTQQMANLRLLFGYMWAHPGRKLLFMGGELGQLAEWNHDSQIEWDRLSEPDHAGIQEMVRALNFLYRSDAALHELALAPEGFEWIDHTDAKNSVIAFLRRATDWHDFVVVVANFSARRLEDYRVGVPFEGEYRVIFDTEDPVFTGSASRANPPGSEDRQEVHYQTAAAVAHGKDCSLTLSLSPLSVLYLKRV